MGCEADVLALVAVCAHSLGHHAVKASILPHLVAYLTLLGASHFLPLHAAAAAGCRVAVVADPLLLRAVLCAVVV